MKLYHHPMSHHARRVVMLCEELGLRPELASVDLAKGEHRSEAFLALNPAGQVPVLHDGAVTLPESHVIMKHLVAKAGGSPLYPEDPAARAQIDRWLDWTHATLNPPVQTIAIQTFVMGAAADRNVIAGAHAQAAAALAGYEAALGRGSAASDPITLADLAIASTLALYRMAGGDFAAFPCVTARFDAVALRPSFGASAPKAA